MLFLFKRYVPVVGLLALAIVSQPFFAPSTDEETPDFITGSYLTADDAAGLTCISRKLIFPKDPEDPEDPKDPENPDAMERILARYGE